MADGDAVTLAWVHNGVDVTYSFFWSFLNLMMWDSGHGNRINRGGFAAAKYATGGIVAARRNIVRGWLEESESPWLAFIDTDMGFAPDTIDRLREVADPVERPVVGALCFAQAVGSGDGWGGYRPAVWPVVMRWSDGPAERGFHPWLDYPRVSVVRVDASGAACLLIHRSVFEQLRAQHGPGWSGWFDPLPAPRAGAGELSEDFSFCLRLREAKIPVLVHTGVRTTHLKPAWLSEDGYLAARAQATTPLNASAPPVEPATEKVAVIVPVLRRPHNARPFMESLRATTDLATVYAVADEDDTETIEAWVAAGANVIVDNLVTFPRKANLGYRVTDQPWLLLVGDDVRFHAGWLDHAMHVARDSGAHVVATNDLGNPRVIAGQHATHPLIRRSYVDEVGASWDGPGVVAHEGYRHAFCDTEWTEAAKARGVFAAAPWAVIEHHHPYWSKAEPDDTYRLGEAHFDADRQLFEARIAANIPLGVCQ